MLPFAHWAKLLLFLVPYRVSVSGIQHYCLFFSTCACAIHVNTSVKWCIMSGQNVFCCREVSLCQWTRTDDPQGLALSASCLSLSTCIDPAYWPWYLPWHSSPFMHWFWLPSILYSLCLPQCPAGFVMAKFRTSRPGGIGLGPHTPSTCAGVCNHLLLYLKLWRRGTCSARGPHTNIAVSTCTTAAAVVRWRLA